LLLILTDKESTKGNQTTNNLIRSQQMIIVQPHFLQFLPLRCPARGWTVIPGPRSAASPNQRLLPPSISFTLHQLDRLGVFVSHQVATSVACAAREISDQIKSIKLRKSWKLTGLS